jgi:hypothetical protein
MALRALFCEVAPALIVLTSIFIPAIVGVCGNSVYFGNAAIKEE